MSLPPLLSRLRLPVVGAPLFIVSNPQPGIAQCQGGIGRGGGVRGRDAPPSPPLPSAASGRRRAAVHRLQSRAGDRPVQGGHRRLLSGAESVAAEPARRGASPATRGAPPPGRE